MLIPLFFVLATAGSCRPSYSFMIWDWTATWQNMAAFRERVEQCKEAGFDTIDLTAPWKSLETTPGVFDFAAIDDRVECVRKAGLKVRLRINVSYAHAWPEWYPAVLMTARDGRTPGDVLSPFSPGAVDRWARVSEEVAAHFKDRIDCYMPGFGMHMEIKYGDWISYENPALGSFRTWLSSRYGSIAALNSAWGSNYRSFELVEPPVPAPPGPKPDLSRASIDFIQFREDQLAWAARRFMEGIRKGYPKAAIAVQLGEAYRSQSAAFSNQEYGRYSESADEIVHSYDFFVHPPDQPHHAFESVRTFIGTTGKPVIVEFDGPILRSSFGYSDSHLVEIARACLDAGASGIHVSNYSDMDPRKLEFIKGIAEMVKTRTIEHPPADSLFYISKWTIYCLRRPDEKLHERIYGYYRKLSGRGERLRIISDCNLSEDLSGYRKLYVSYSPVMSEKSLEALRELQARMQWEADGKVGVYRLN